MSEMKKIRIGNDIVVKPVLTATEDGREIQWTSAVKAVVAFNDVQRMGVHLPFEVSEGVLTATFKAEQQKYLGAYRIMVVMDDGNTATWDAPSFELVPLTEMADEDTLGLVAIEVKGELHIVTGGAVWGKILGDINDQKDLRKFLPFKITDDNAAVELARDIEGLLHKNLTFSFASGRISLPLRKVEGEYVYNSAESPKYPSRIMAAACIPGSCVYDDDNTTPHPLAKIVSVRYDDLYAYITLDTELEDGEYYLSTGQAAGGASIALNGFAGGKQALAMGYSIANGTNAFATGLVTLAEGDRSHAEGFATVAEGMISHAEGQKTLAKGRISHAEGNYTVAENRGEHAEGQYNVSRKDSEDFGSAGNTAHTVGIGTSVDDRKNAQEVMQNGDFYVMGMGGYDGKSIEGKKTLQEVINELPTSDNTYTKEEVDVKLASKAEKDTTYTKEEVNALIPDISGKANKSEVYTKTQVDVALSGKADNSALIAVASELANKASNAALNALASEVSGKASQSDLTTLATSVANKADKTYVDGQLQTKASSAELTELSRKVDEKVADAPKDGKAYTRKDGEWVEDAGGDVPADIEERLEDLENDRKYNHSLGKTRIKDLSVDEPIKVCNAPMVLIGSGAPSASNVPQNWDKETMGEWFGIPNFIGQMYVNISASSNALYIAVNDTAVSGWKSA